MIECYWAKMASSFRRAVSPFKHPSQWRVTIYCDVIVMANPLQKIWMSDLSYANHAPIMKKPAGSRGGLLPLTLISKPKWSNENGHVGDANNVGVKTTWFSAGFCHNSNGPQT